MNYYERHLGDYSKNASHLSLLEHGVYVRLIDVYYTKECPIPVSKAARWIGAETEAETQALQVVLEEFFLRDGNVWRQPRCDEEIAAYVSGEPEREAKKANETTRLQRHREERAKLFKALNGAGLHADWNIKIGELRRLVAEIEAKKSATAAPPLPATAPATPATATQPPPPTTQVSETEIQAPATEAGRVCRAIRSAGIPSVSPSNPLLHALLAAGATVEEFLEAAPKAIGKRDGFAYLLSVVKGQREDAVHTAKGLHVGEMPRTETAYQRSQRERIEQVAPSIAARKPGVVKPHPLDILDGLVRNAD